MVRLEHTHFTTLAAPVEKTKDYQLSEEEVGGAAGSQEVIAESRNEMMASQFIRDAPNKSN